MDCQVRRAKRMSPTRSKMLRLAAATCLLAVLVQLLQVHCATHRPNDDLAKGLELESGANITLIKEFMQVALGSLRKLKPSLNNEAIPESKRLIELMPVRRLIICAELLERGRWKHISAKGFPYGCCILAPVKMAVPMCRLRDGQATEKPTSKDSTTKAPHSTTSRPKSTRPAAATTKHPSSKPAQRKRTSWQRRNHANGRSDRRSKPLAETDPERGSFAARHKAGSSTRAPDNDNVALPDFGGPLDSADPEATSSPDRR